MFFAVIWRFQSIFNSSLGTTIITFNALGPTSLFYLKTMGWSEPLRVDTELSFDI